MTTITKTQRAEIVDYLSDRYASETVVFHRDGSVSAKIDPDKDPGCHNQRVWIGCADELLRDIKDAREARAASAAEFA